MKLKMLLVLFLLSVSGFAFCGQEPWRVVVFQKNFDTQYVALVSSFSSMKTNLSGLADSTVKDFTVSVLSHDKVHMDGIPSVLFANEANGDGGFKDEVHVIAQVNNNGILIVPANKNVQDFPLIRYEFLFKKIFGRSQISFVFDNNLKRVMRAGNFVAFYDLMRPDYNIKLDVDIEPDDLKDLNKNDCYFDSGLLEHVIKNYDTLKDQFCNLFFAKRDAELESETLQNMTFIDKIFSWLCKRERHFYYTKKLFPDTYYSVILKHSNGFQRNFLKFALMPLIMGIIVGGLLAKS